MWIKWNFSAYFSMHMHSQTFCSTWVLVSQLDSGVPTVVCILICKLMLKLHYMEEWVMKLPILTFSRCHLFLLFLSSLYPSGYHFLWQSWEVKFGIWDKNTHNNLRFTLYLLILRYDFFSLHTGWCFQLFEINCVLYGYFPSAYDNNWYSALIPVIFVCFFIFE